jgi:hypothetical protein
MGRPAAPGGVVQHRVRATLNNKQQSSDSKMHVSDPYAWLFHGSPHRLEQLLALGSLVIKEESGYQAFYHHLLQPGVHYVPFWKKVG